MKFKTSFFAVPFNFCEKRSEMFEYMTVQEAAEKMEYIASVGTAVMRRNLLMQDIK